MESCIEVLAYVGGMLTNIIPESTLWDMETVLIWVSCYGLVVVLCKSFLVLLFPDVADALEEEKSEDVVFVVS